MGESTPDCLIVGGGLIGMLTARTLHRCGLRVCVLERGHAGGESSWAGGGILSPLYPWRYPQAVNVLATWSRQVYPQLAEDLAATTGIDPEWTPSGLLILEDGEEKPAHTWAQEWQEALEVVDEVCCRELEPAVGAVPDRSLWLPAVAQIRNPRLLRALRAELRSTAGIELLEGVEVVQISYRNAHVEGVSTAAGDRYRAPNVVVAGGAWSGTLLARLGVRLPVYPVRGQMLLYRAQPTLVRHIILSQGRYVIPRRDGYILVGSSVEEVGFDRSITSTVREDLQAAAARMIPALAEQPLVRQWAGLRPGAPAGIPYIGAVPGIAGLYVNCGHFRNGVVLGPASARLLADLLTGVPPEVDPAPYDPGRKENWETRAALDFLSP